MATYDNDIKVKQGPAGTAGSPPVFSESGSAPPPAATTTPITTAAGQQQAHSEKRGYAQATPIASLGRYPAVIDCPLCGVRSLTTVEASTGSVTHLMALFMCLSCCLGCIPYVMGVFKDVTHQCGNCQTAVAVRHRSGEVEVLVHPTTTVNVASPPPTVAGGVGGSMGMVETGVVNSGNPKK